MNKHNEPIAIVGMGCRFPGSGSSPEKFWELLLNKTNAIIDVPSDRWDNRRFYHDDDGKPGKTRCKKGGFLAEDISQFDSLFFGISPRQGECLDPQSRLLLEVSYEAFEDAGMTLEELKGSNTGVFVGCFTFDNSVLQIAHGNDKIMDSDTSTGLSYTILSNRISYAFDLKGPSLSIDTACSSSLVSLHYACQSLWNGETERCVVGGVNLILLQYNSVSMSKGMFLSKDGSCKAFDDRANGYVRSEGAGAVIIKPLSQAVKDGDRIYSVILGTGVNQDGQTNGMTVPNKSAQKALIKKIYKEQNINPKDIHYFEAHGTGTPVGDPLEFSAINEVLAESGEVEEKCLLGSVKTNIGHLEAGASIAGLIKTSLCLHHNAVPANLHFENPNPALNYEESLLKIPTELEHLPAGRSSLASINSFGYGGTNAHAVLKQYDPATVNKTQENNGLKNDQFIFPISAKNKTALKQLASAYKSFIGENSDKFENILSNTIYRRTHFSNRLAITAASQEELVEKLEAYEEDILIAGVVENRIAKTASKIAFVYTGMGPQWWKMGREMMEKEPVFYDAVKECDLHFKAIAGWSILEELQQPEESSKIKETHIAQPANFVIQVALTRLLAHYGVQPEAVVGHSVGEVASAYISGALSLKDALTVSFHRSRLQGTTAGKGTMVAVGLSEPESLKMINGYNNVSIAAINSPSSMTLAGDDENVQKIAKKCEEMGVFNRVLEVAVPYHSPVMSLIKDELLVTTSETQGQATTVDLYSTVTGEKIEGTEINNQYWWRNVREPVRFSKTIDSLVEDGYNVFVEIGPHPVLRNSITQCVGEQNPIHLIQTLNKKKSEEVAHFYENLNQLYTLGFQLKWDNWVDRLPHMPLPAYPWQREHLWRETKASKELRLGRPGNVFLNRLVNAPQTTYQVELNKYYFPFLVDHTIQDRKVFPGAAYITAGIALSQKVIKNEFPLTIENIAFHQMLTVDETKVQNLYTSFDSKNYGYSVYSKEDQDDAFWVKRATGKLVVGKQHAKTEKLDLEKFISQMTSVVTEEEVYAKLNKGMLNLGPFFNTVKEIHVNGNESMARIQAHPDVRVTEADHEYIMHPTLLDGCFQALAGFDDGYERTDFVPVSIDKVHVYATPADELYCHAVLRYSDEKVVSADMYIYNSDGTIAVEVEDFRCQGITPDKIEAPSNIAEKFVYPEWVKEEKTETTQTTNSEAVYYILTPDLTTALPFVNDFSEDHVVLELGTEFKKITNDHYKFDLSNMEALTQIINTNQKIILVSLLNLEVPKNWDAKVSEICIDLANPIMEMARFIYDNAAQTVSLNILTKDSQKVTDNDQITNGALSIVYGLGRTLVNEMPNAEVRLVDLKSTEDTSFALDLIAKRMDQTVGRFEELSVRNGSTYLKKFVKGESVEKVSLSEEIVFQDRNLQLLASKRSGIDGLKFVAAEREAPGPGQIEILIDRTSVDAKDCLKVLGKMELKTIEGTYTEEALGMVCYGMITRIGEGVTKFGVGDKVMAIAGGTFQTHTNTAALLAIHRPDNLKEDESQALYSYLTALYSLKEKARLRKGDKVLIHHAAKGVGLAAVNYAKLMGAEIFATAQSEKNSDYLRSIGVEHIFSAHDLSFAKKILERTEGKGVNVVLSDLSGEMIYQNFSVLAPYGMYLELGKNEDALLPTKFFHKNLSYIVINMDKMCKDRPEKINFLLTRLQEYFESNKLPPLPATCFGADKVSDAFHLINKGENIGEVVLNFKNQKVNVDRKNVVVNPNGSYLITGGTRGLGLEIGKWLADNGAKNIALLSRSGLKEAYAKQTVEALLKRGVNVQVYSADIGDAQQMATVFTQMEEQMPKLAGIFHGAMVLDDAYLLDLNESRFRKSFGPKVDGAINLFDLTKDMHLDYFVLFSSISSLIGNVGQGNYVAANAFLDSFAEYSRSEGVNAIALNLGVMRESGVVSRNEKLGKMLENIGTLGLTNEMFFTGLKSILEDKPTQVGFFNLDWETFSQNTGDSSKFLFGNIFATEGGINNGLTEEQELFLENLTGVGASEQIKFVADGLIEEICAILKIRKEKVDTGVGVNFLGVDSILAAELIINIKKKFIVEILPIEFLSGPSIDELSRIVLGRLQKQFLTADNEALV